MEVVLLKDVSGFGFAGQIKKVTKGYAQNFLFTKKLAREANQSDIERAKKMIVQSTVDKEIAGSRIAMLAETLKNLHLSISEKVNNLGKLYGAINQDDIVTLLASKNIKIDRKQVEFPKAIRTVGEHEIIIRLSSKLKPVIKLKVLEKKSS